ncbi:MAG: hypothetical protein ACT4OZ_15665 [Gemmatimonadota bacterium]
MSGLRGYPQFEFERSFLEAVRRSRAEHTNPGRVRAMVLTSLRKQGFTAA